MGLSLTFVSSRPRSGEVEEEEFGRLVRTYRQTLLVADGRAVARAQLDAVELQRAFDDLRPSPSSGAQLVDGLFARREQPAVDLCVLPHRDRAVAPFARGDEAEPAAPLLFGELALLVAGRVAAALGRDPDLQEVDGLLRRRVELAVRDARARAHALHLARADDRAVAHAVAVLERAADDVGQNLHVAVRVRAEAARGRDEVLVDDEEVAEARPARVVVAVERERVAAVEPARLRLPALVGGAFDDHHSPPDCSPEFVRSY